MRAGSQRCRLDLHPPVWPELLAALVLRMYRLAAPIVAPAVLSIAQSFSMGCNVNTVLGVIHMWHHSPQRSQDEVQTVG